MSVSKPLRTIVSAVCLTAACSAADKPSELSKGPQIVWTASSADDGRCRPEAEARVHKESTQLYKIHGEADYVDLKTGEMTGIPLQYLFRGYDNTGMSRDKSIVILNTMTSCENLKIEAEVQYCLYDDLGRGDERQCPQTIGFEGEGFGELSLIRKDGDKPAH